MALPASDNFNRASLGGNWTLTLNTMAINASTEYIGQTSVDTVAVWNADTFTDDQESEIRVSIVNANTNYVGVTTRTTGAGGRGNAWYSDGSSGASHCEMSTFNAGTFTVLAAIATTLAANDRMKLRSNSTTWTVFKNAVQVDTGTDSTFTTGGAPGIYAFNSGRGDDWIGDNYPNTTAAVSDGPQRVVGRSPARRGPRRPQFTAQSYDKTPFVYPDLFTTEGTPARRTPGPHRGPPGRQFKAKQYAISPANNLFFQSLTGSLDFTGTLQKQTNKQLAGALSFAGALQKETRRALTGVLTFSGALTSQAVFTKALTGVLDFVGSLQKQTNKQLAGSLTPGAGTLQRQTNKQLSGALGFAGGLQKLTLKNLAGVLSFSGALAMSHIIQVVLIGSLSFVGTLTTSFIPGGGPGGTYVYFRALFRSITDKLFRTGYDP